MKKVMRLSVAVGAALCALYGSCVVPPAKSMPRRAAFPAANEKIFLSLAIDSSSLEQAPGWPAESALQAPLRSALKKLDSNMFVEFRRCEKYGLYELVDDSLRGSVYVTFVIGRFQVTKDTLAMPIRMTVSKPALTRTLSRTVWGRGVYRAKSPPKSQLHHLHILIADFCRNFPYTQAAEVFYRPANAPRPGITKKGGP